MVKKRAITNEEKKIIIDRLYEAWKKEPQMRLGQLITVAFKGLDFFYTEDEDFISTIEDDK